VGPMLWGVGGEVCALMKILGVAVSEAGGAELVTMVACCSGVVAVGCGSSGGAVRGV